MRGRIIYDVRELSYILEEELIKVLSKERIFRYLIDDVKHHWFIQRLRDIRALPIVFDERCVLDQRTMTVIKQECRQLDALLYRTVFIPPMLTIDHELKLELRYGDLYLYY